MRFHEPTGRLMDGFTARGMVIVVCPPELIISVLVRRLASMGRVMEHGSYTPLIIQVLTQVSFQAVILRKGL
ncbi:hypothetical protein KY290_000873 [Solanum tuberosum]|uniref:Uncharacterized protein n=1 Tax=Solanum tuberosum TaxID=4113 RepID=A0ABQ7WMS2_SOLTU|nr:hypothetical protein KY289_000933 [Solanum tuberosum]KAH0781275.1 hypothetical protein KY290_000873 [Solanum tuberosum]